MTILQIAATVNFVCAGINLVMGLAWHSDLGFPMALLCAVMGAGCLLKDRYDKEHA